jgi:hypothetical protein
VSARRRAGALAGAASAVSGWLIEPAAPAPVTTNDGVAGTRPVVAVFGLARRCGASTVARALAAELAARDAGGAAAVACIAAPVGVPLASRPATALARVLADVPGATTRAVGRLCLVGGAEPLALSDTARQHAPFVLDAGSAAVGGAPAAVADRIVLVATARVEPALAAVVGEGIARIGPAPLVVVNRVREPLPKRWDDRDALSLPEARMGAQLALGGREPRGTLGAAIAQLADRVTEGAVDER